MSNCVPVLPGTRTSFFENQIEPNSRPTPKRLSYAEADWPKLSADDNDTVVNSRTWDNLLQRLDFIPGLWTETVVGSFDVNYDFVSTQKRKSPRWVIARETR